MTQTSVGPGPNRGGNENHENDPSSKTLGENAPQTELPAGAELVGAAAPEVPAAVPGGQPRPGVRDPQGIAPDPAGPAGDTKL